MSLTLQAGSNSGITTDSITHGDGTGQLVFDLGSVNSDVNPATDVVVKDGHDQLVDGMFTQNNGKWIFTTTANKLTDGTHTLHTEVTDSHGNTATGTPTNVTVDTQAGISITHVATDDIIDSHEITNGFDISGTVDHVEAGQQVVITWTDYKGTTHTVTDANAITQVTAGQTAGTWNAHIPASELSAANLPDGFTPTFTVTVVDVAGNSVQNTSTPTVDSQAQVTVALDDGGTKHSTHHLGDGFINIAEQQQVHLHGTLEAGATLDDIVISDGTHTYHVAASMLSGATHSGENYSLIVNLLTDLVDGNGARVVVAHSHISPFTVGDNTLLNVTATATDKTGNTSNSVMTHAHLDTLVHKPGTPDLTHTSDGKNSSHHATSGRSDHDLISPDGSPRVAFRADKLDKSHETLHAYDEFKGQTYEVGDKNSHTLSQVQPGHSYDQFKAGAYHFDEDAHLVNGVGHMDGEHVYHAEIHDDHGNVGKSGDLTVTIDTHIDTPTLSFTNTNGHQGHSLRPELHISGISRSDNMWKVELIDGKTSLGTAVKNENNIWGHIDASGQWEKGLPAGFVHHTDGSWGYTLQHDLKGDKHTYTVSVTDVAGNNAISTLDWVNDAPTATDFHRNVNEGTQSISLLLQDFGDPKDTNTSDGDSVANVVLEKATYGNGHVEVYKHGNWVAAKDGEIIPLTEIGTNSPRNHHQHGHQNHVRYVIDDTFDKAHAVAKIAYHVTDSHGVNSSGHHDVINVIAGASKPVFNITNHTLSASTMSTPTELCYDLDLSVTHPDTDGSEDLHIFVDGHQGMSLFDNNGHKIALIGSAGNTHWDIGNNPTTHQPYTNAELKQFSLRFNENYQGLKSVRLHATTTEHQGQEQSLAKEFDVSFAIPTKAGSGIHLVEDVTFDKSNGHMLTASADINGAIAQGGINPSHSHLAFQAQIIHGRYGDLELQKDGTWAYHANNDQRAVQELNADVKIDEFISSHQGTTHSTYQITEELLQSGLIHEGKNALVEHFEVVSNSGVKVPIDVLITGKDEPVNPTFKD